MAEHPSPAPEHTGSEHTPRAITAGPESPDRAVVEAQARLQQRYEVPAPDQRASAHPDSNPGDLVAASDSEDFLTPVVDADGQVEVLSAANALRTLDFQIGRTAQYEELVAKLQDMELQGLVKFEEGKPRVIENAVFAEGASYKAPDGRVVTPGELYERGYLRLRTLDRINTGDQTPATFAVRTELHNQRAEAQREELMAAREEAQAQKVADEAKAARTARAHAKLEAAARGTSSTDTEPPKVTEPKEVPDGQHIPAPEVNLAPTADMVEAKTGQGPFKVDAKGEVSPTTQDELNRARASRPGADRRIYDPEQAHAMAVSEKPGRDSVLRPLRPARPVDTTIRPNDPREANYETDIDSAMEQAFQNDRGASEMTALAAEYRMQHELLMQETNTSLTHDRMVNGELQKGTMTLLEESYKEAIKEVRDRYQKHKDAADGTIKKLLSARANHEDMEASILSGKGGESTSKAWVLRHELRIPDGAQPLTRYGGTRSYGGMFRGARMIQRVYDVPGGGYLVECVKANTGEFVRSTVINSGREPMRFGRFRLPFTGTEIEKKLKTLRAADLKRERPKNLGEYFGVRFGPELPQRSGQFAYDMSGTAAWDSQLGGPRYNAPRRKPWYLSMWIVRPR